MKTKMISVLLTKRKDRFSRLTYWLTGRKYTHASIRLDGTGESFYSFTAKGFCREPLRWLSGRNMSSSILYRIKVSEDTYESAKILIEQFLVNRHVYHYSLLGSILCFLHIPFRLRNCYFCSQFVAEILKNSGAVELKRKPYMYLPNTLDRELRQCKVLYEYFPEFTQRQFVNRHPGHTKAETCDAEIQA